MEPLGRPFTSWRDAGIESGPEGQPGRGLQRPAGWLKRKPDGPWFCVIGSLGRDPEAFFVIGAGWEWTNSMGREDPLFAFANDAPWFYVSNIGEILLDVRRTR